MSATNKTPNYNLPVYRDYDITSYLIDFNGAMEKIDTVLKQLSDSITGGEGTIGEPTDFMATSTQSVTVRNNQAGSTNALLTIMDVQPASYAVSGNITIDPNALTDDNFGELLVAFNGEPILPNFIVKFYKTDKPNTYSFATPLKVTQKGIVTLEARIVSAESSSMTITGANMMLQKLDI